jgi:hypothetical protein
MKDSFEVVNIFKYIKTIQISLLHKNILLRGGIVKGKLYHTDDLLLGPGMINAFSLESKCALHPRIVIDPKVLWQFSRINGKRQPERIKDFDYEKSFISETDGIWYIDYFNDVIEYLSNESSIQNYFRLLCHLIAKNIDNEDISIRVKYLWLREKLKKCEYYESHKTDYKAIVNNRRRKNQI